MRRRNIYILLLILWSWPLYAQLITVKSEFNADSIMIGEQIRYILSIESAQDLEISIPIYSDTISRSIELLKEFDPDTIHEDGRRIIRQEFLVTSFEPGWNTVPSQAITFSTEEFTDTAFTSALLLTVLAPAVDTTLAIKPIKGPVNTPVSFAEIWPWASLGLLILGIVAAAFYFYRRYREKKNDPEGALRKPLEPAHVIAFRELEELRLAKLPHQGRVKEYYSRLTDIIRVYMGRQYSIHAMESTTSEILEAFARTNLQEEKLNEQLENLLMLADLVKFAKEDPLMEDNERHFSNAEYFIESTYKMFREEEEMGESLSESESETVEEASAGDQKDSDKGKEESNG